MDIQYEPELDFKSHSKGSQKMYSALKVQKNTFASIILKWKKFGATKTLPRAGPPSQTEQWGEKGLGQGGDQEPDGHSDRAPEFLCGDGRTFQKKNHLQHSTNQSFMAEWPDRNHSSVKGT